jgi:preprotein translocase SecF subunit
MHLGSDADQKYTQQAQAIVDAATRARRRADFVRSAQRRGRSGGGGFSAGWLFSLGFRRAQRRDRRTAGGGAIARQALLATAYSLAGMLIYLGFRFEWIYGVAAVVTVFHDTLITVGAFSLLNKDISLTVIAAILTLIGYSNNDTIVVFDRIRENIKLMRREKLSEIVNRSINQTLSRTILTAGLTFLTVLALYLFGARCCAGSASRW